MAGTGETCQSEITVSQSESFAFLLAVFTYGSLAPRYFGEVHVPVRYSREICFVPVPESKESLGFVACKLQCCGDFLLALEWCGNPCCALKHTTQVPVTGKPWHFEIWKLFVCAVAMCPLTQTLKVRLRECKGPPFEDHCKPASNPRIVAVLAVP